MVYLLVDEGLLSVFVKGEDIYKVIVSEVFGVVLDEVIIE